RPGGARGRAGGVRPGPCPLVLPTPGRRYHWLCGSHPERIGLRVAELDARLAAAIDRVPALLLTSANAARSPRPAPPVARPPALAPPAVAFAALDPVAPITAVALDGGTCPGGVPSTVVDL